MTDRSDSGTGSVGGNDTDLSRDITTGSAGSTGGAAGSTDVGAGDVTTAAGGGDLGMSTGSEFSSTPARSSTSESVTTGSSMPARDLASGADVGETPAGRTDVGETTGGGGGIAGSLPGAAIGALAGAALGAAASAMLGAGGREGSSYIEHAIEVNAPVRTVYNQWTQFEEFPKFMEGVERVQQLDDKRLHWHADIGFKDKEWDAEIVDQVPDQRVAWRSTSGAPNGGVVTFQPLDATRTRVTLRLEYTPDGLVENVGDTLGLVSRRVEGDLARFKQFIEARGTETGGWRGEI